MSAPQRTTNFSRHRRRHRRGWSGRPSAAASVTGPRQHVRRASLLSRSSFRIARASPTRSFHAGRAHATLAPLLEEETECPTPTSPTPSPAATPFCACSSDEGVVKMFGNPGTTELPIMHALSSAPEMGYVLAPAGGRGHRHGRRLRARLGQAGVVQRPCGARPRQRHRLDLHLDDVGHADDRDRRPAGAGPRADRAPALRAAGADRARRS